jgi:uncharacterized protein (TIGR02646 family)
MKPVKKGVLRHNFTKYGQAKVHLLERLGQHCSYCEAYGEPQTLDVEHIYPKKPHPELELKWRNFLIACKSCNSYKNAHLGNDRQTGLESRYVWPHRDNTFRAFKYFSDGRVDLKKGLKKLIRIAAEATREMVGLLSSPAKAAEFSKRGIAYDGARKRSQQWRQAEDFKKMYLKAPSPFNATTIADAAMRMGYFSIWMEVFHDRPEMRCELIRAFKADKDCFNANFKPIKKGRV